jgi:DNA-binding CsgD family transcriptional regulator
VAEDPPVRAALVAGGPERDRWHAWLSGAGVHVELCESLAAATSLVPRVSIAVVDAAVLDAVAGATGTAGIPVVVLGRHGGALPAPGVAATLPRTAPRAAVVGTVLAVSAGLVVHQGPGGPRTGAPAAERGAPPDGRTARAADREPEAVADEWWSESPTPREREVIELVALGLTNRAIAARLGLSAHTVKFHLASIYAKLGARGRTQAVRRAIRRGWISI